MKLRLACAMVFVIGCTACSGGVATPYAIGISDRHDGGDASASNEDASLMDGQSPFTDASTGDGSLTESDGNTSNDGSSNNGDGSSNVGDGGMRADASSSTRDGSTDGSLGASDGSSSMDSGPSGGSADAGDAGRDSGISSVDAGDSGSAGDSGPVCATITADIVINEILLSPVNDWSRSDNGGLSYRSGPGTGTVNTRDQYIELYNAGTLALDLRNWRLDVVDSTPDTTVLGVGSPVILTTPGSSISSLQPGHYLLIGDPSGFISTDAYLTLREPCGTVIDDVEVGGLIASRDFEHDGTGDGAPDATWNGFARGTYDETISRPNGSVDTNNDAADFDRMLGTPLAPNIVPAPPIESIPPTVTGFPTGTGIRVTGALNIQISEAVDSASADRSITVLANGIPVPLDFHTFMKLDSLIVVNPTGRLPFSATIQVTILGGPLGLTDKAGNALASTVVFSFQTEAAPSNPAQIVINEICASPLQDWNDSLGGDGIAFSAIPGNGDVNSEDEWVEVLNLRTGNTDFSAYSLVVYSGATIYSPAYSQTFFANDLATVRIFGGSTDIRLVAQNNRIVMGNLNGSIPRDFFMELRDQNGVLIDQVEVGGNTASVDRGGNGIRNGAPGPDQDGSSSSFADEAVARFPDGVDTGVDVNDWSKSTTSLGNSN